MDQVKIFDATLYGGGQSPGTGLNIEERLEIARLLDQMGVDVIQAGFPISSPRDYRAVRRLATEIRNSAVCALARAAGRGYRRSGCGAAWGCPAANPGWFGGL